MVKLSFVEKQTIKRLFGISDGYIFSYWFKNGEHNKTTTKELILDACGINIFDDSEYCGLSQQKCIEKIIATCDSNSVAKLLNALCEYFSFKMGDAWWSEEDNHDYHSVKEIIERLEKDCEIELPENEDVKNYKVLLDDISSNFTSGKPEMAIDRLHNYATEFFRSLCRKHRIQFSVEKGSEDALHSLVGKLKKWYGTSDYFESSFSLTAIGASISVFDSYNSIRNDKSAAHPSDLLNKSEAEYAVRIILDTINFIDRIEKIKDQELAEKKEHEEYLRIHEGISIDDFPF